MVLEASGDKEYVALMPLAKWLSKRFNLPLTRNDKRPRRAEVKSKRLNGIQVKSNSELGQEMGKMPKTKQESGSIELKQDNALLSPSIQEPESPDDLSFYSGVEALKRRETSNKAFVSTDATENADIKDEAWDKIKNMKTDQERMNHAQKRFKNKQPGEPNRNMSIHGYRRYMLAQGNEEWQKSRDETKANPKFFESRVKNIVQLKEGKIETVYTDPQEYNSMNKKRKSDEREETPRPKKPKLMTFKDYEEKVVKALGKYKKPQLGEKFTGPKIIETYWRYYLRHFKNSMEETHAFFKSYGEYRDAANNVMMTYDELKANECAEMIFSQFVTPYGRNPVTRCKDCEEVDKTMGKEVLHPY